jgi:hypothetical protein
MSDWTPIPSTPLQICLTFVKVDDTPPPERHYIHSPGGGFWEQVLLQNVSPDQEDAVKQLLEGQSPDFDARLQHFLDQQWTVMKSQASTSIVKAVQTNIPEANNISVESLPNQGTLRATSGHISSGLVSSLPSGETGQQLTLSYLLSGFKVNFDMTNTGPLGSWADANVDLTFDGEYLIEIIIPSKSTIPLFVNAEFWARNLTPSADNFFSDLVLIENYLQDLFNAAFTGISIPGLGGQQPDSVVPMSVPDAFNKLSGAFLGAASKGFTQLSVWIDQNPPDGNPPGNTVVIELIQPFVKAPTPMFDSGPYLPELIAIAQAHAGETITVNGLSFPPPRATKAGLWWDSGLAPHSTGTVDVRWGIPAPNEVVPATYSQKQLSFDYTLPNPEVMLDGLSPSTRYAFNVRTYTVDGFIASDWSGWVVFTTRPTDDTTLHLEGDTSSTPLTILQPINENGTFSLQLTIPVDEKPGTYNISATVPGQPDVVLSSIQVFAVGQALPPSIVLIDDAGNQLVSGKTEINSPSRQYEIKGENWMNGPLDIWLGGISGTLLGEPWADHNGMFIMKNITFPDASTKAGDRQLSAVQAGWGTAAFDMYFLGPPQ